MKKTPIGIDEVGRGSIAGPLCVCALRLSPKSSFYFSSKIRDSKKLTPTEREIIFHRLIIEKNEGKINYAIAYISALKIDSLGMSYSLKAAVAEALKKINAKLTDSILLDGSLKAPGCFRNQTTLIRGDEKEIAIALASVVAKVSRDRRMVSYSKKWPRYGFENHKGYGTQAHFVAIKKCGLVEIHRHSFLRRSKEG
jgi:ribonuclease HII